MIKQSNADRDFCYKLHQLGCNITRMRELELTTLLMAHNLLTLAHNQIKTLGNVVILIYFQIKFVNYTFCYSLAI